MLTNKIIIVTGGEGLIGNEIVASILEKGGTAISADIEDKGRISHERRHFINIDITSEKSVTRVLDDLIAKFGKIDGWVNNAYPRTTTWGQVDFLDESEDDWAANVDMHMNGYVRCCRLVGKVMVTQKFGAIVNLASIYGMLGPDFTIYNGTSMKNPAGYAAIKGGILNLTRYLAADFGPHGVRVNSASPGGVFNHQPQQFVDQYESKVPMKRMALPADIAPPICFLLSDDASYITGHNLVIDGGWAAI